MEKSWFLTPWSMHFGLTYVVVVRSMVPYFYVPYPLVVSNQSGRVFQSGLYYIIKVQAGAPQAPKRYILHEKSSFFTVVSVFIFQRPRAAKGVYFSEDRAPRADDAGGAWPSGRLVSAWA